MAQTNNRLPYVDFAKGMGILLVICSHASPSLMSWAAPCFVPLFYVLSGYTTTHTVSVRNKFERLIIPYVFFSMLLVGVHRHFTAVSLAGIAYSRLCLYPFGTEDNTMLMVSNNQPLWFLTSLFVSFLLVRLAQGIDRQRLVVPLFLLLAFGATFLPVLLPWSIDTAFLTALFIMAGIEMRRYDVIGRLHWSHLLGITIVYAALTYLCGSVNLSVRNYGFSLFAYLPAALLGSVMLMMWSDYLSRISILSAVQKLGRHSLPVFCIHLPFVYVWNKVLQNLPFMLPSVVLGMSVVLLTVVSTYPLALLFDRYMMKYIIKR